ncbi:hypothetical protein A2419_00970 [Candidatus Adlerbacteria bacterium RIFOXYC1_FULL_48_26]|uniref:DUF6817 domain-containing protein n=1 Tax=Candidatus Adlerbacteria bacterium RIFOXYC1_FULL_48_26 TaxID=1797247 RepID=A0A1F4Y2R0_9BACT|nr:MAG: hypothetical protein A2419_00970 [Candidatus Adlerbacteria bacterium RIFOXYC1_FULL_48_26]
MSLASAAAKTYLTNKGAKNIRHVRGSLLDHLSRIEETLKGWNTPEHVQLAGLFHSVFGTDHFKKELLGEADTEQVRLLIGEKALRLVSLFSSIDRFTISSKRTPSGYSALHKDTYATIPLTKEETSEILHIFLANAIDHLFDVMYEGAMVEINHYVPFAELFTPKAQEALQKLNRGTHPSEEFSPGLRFIGHAGVWLKTEEGSLVVDPWLYSSTFEQPVLRGLQPYQRTIDFLIPRPVFKGIDLKPDIVLLSHFHTHHAPLESIKKFAGLKPIRVICPALSEDDHAWLRTSLGELYEKITFEASDEAREHTFPNLTVRVFTHPKPHHLGFVVKTPKQHFVHVTDACVNADVNRLSLDPMWETVRDLKPDMLFISAANHLSRWGAGSKRTVGEHASLSPTQAAKITALMGAKRVGLIGMDNFSIWDSAIEYAHTAEAIENEFQWVIDYLAPNVEFIPLRPGKKIL